MDKSQAVTEWADGQAVRDTVTGETGTVCGPVWWNGSYEIRMDEGSVHNAEFGFTTSKFRRSGPGRFEAIG